MKHFHNTTLLPKFENTLTYKFQMFVKSFMINVGLFKSLLFFAVIGIALQCAQSLSFLSGALSIQRLTVGEYISSVLSIVIILLISLVYMCYFIDIVLKWGFEMDD
jgi:hypothetical protein